MEFLARIQFSHLFFIFFIATNASTMAMEKKAPEYITSKNVQEHQDILEKEYRKETATTCYDSISAKKFNLARLEAIRKKTEILNHVSKGNSVPLQSYHDLTAYKDKLDIQYLIMADNKGGTERKIAINGSFNTMVD
jgi:hypothetical protein